MKMDNRQDDAIAWHVRLGNPDATGDDWADFTDWLEADPANADAYDAVAMADATLAEARGTSASANNDNLPIQTSWHQRRGFFAIAAGVALAVVATPYLLSGRSLEEFSTRPGETRDIALGDGSHIILNGDTKLKLDRKSNRFAELASGEALFSIRHDSAKPFEVQIGDATLRDIGTIFNVRHDDGELDVAVSDGAVQYNPDGEGLTVPAGNWLQIANGQRVPIVKAIDKASVAGWRTGILTYQEQRLSILAADLSRSLGTKVTVSPDIANRQFSGSIRVERDQSLLFSRLEALLAIHATHSDKGWQLTS